MGLGAIGKELGPSWCRTGPGGGQSWGNRPAAPWDPLCPPASPPDKEPLGQPSPEQGLEGSSKISGLEVLG